MRLFSEVPMSDRANRNVDGPVFTLRTEFAQWDLFSTVIEQRESGRRVSRTLTGRRMRPCANATTCITK